MGLCDEYRQVDEPLEINSIPPNEIPAPTAPVEGWGWVLRVWSTRLGK